jgi:predicted transcriptional regulator
MSKKELIEKASDAVGGGATGVSKSADPTGGTATLPNSKSNGEPMKKLDDNTPGQSISDTDSANNTKAVGDQAGSNKSSVAMKPSAASSMKEEMLAIMGDDLSEEFKEKAATIFEAAVSGQVSQLRAALQEEFDSKQTQLDEDFQTAVSEMKTEIAEQVNEYLDYVVEEWMKQNEVAVVGSLRAEISEEFIGNLKSLFEQSYISVPDAQVDVLDEMAASMSDLEEKYNALVAEKIDLEKKLEESTKDTVFADVAEGLALSQVEKFRSLAEGVSYDSVESYKKKLDLVKEQYFGQKAAPAVMMLEEETAVDLNEEVTKPAVDRGVSRYVSAISRTVKK